MPQWRAALVMGLGGAAVFFTVLTFVPSVRRLIASAVGAPADIELATAIGETRSIRLPRNGSRATLEPDSRLSYHASLFEREHVVTLRGAATFNVVPQGCGVLRISHGQVFVQVQGTRFTVRSYPGESSASAFVSRGRVLVSGVDRRSVTVNTGELARIVGRTAIVGSGSADDRVSFFVTTLRFDRVPLSEAIEALRHWYGLPIRLGDAHFAARVVSSSIPVTQDDGIAALCAAVSVRAQRSLGAVVLYDVAPD